VASCGQRTFGRDSVVALNAELRGRLAAMPFALGGAPLGNLFSAVTEVDAVATIAHAYTRGVRYFDTAPHYGHGLSERRFGIALRGIPRVSYVLSTKVGRMLRPDAAVPAVQHGYVGGLPYVQSFDYTGTGFVRALDDSLERLGTEFVDIVYVHDLDRATHGAGFAAHFRALLDSGLPALAALKATGRIGAWGIGVNGVDISLDTLRHADPDVILLAGRYTLADQTALPRLLPECRRRDVAIVLGGPFNSGILATGARPADGTAPYFDYAPATAEVVAHVAAIERVAAAFGVPLRAAALQFPRAEPAVAIVLAGARTRAELDDNLAMLAHPIPPEFWARLRLAGLLPATAHVPGAAA
jgi:D-threo-aldose 1-dehydrogenase